MPEISDQDLEVAKRAVSLLQQLQSDPTARQHLQRSLKVLDPKVETDDEVAAKVAAPYVSKLEEMEKRLQERDEREAKEKEERAEKAALSRLEDGFARLRKEGVTEEGLEKIKALMAERTIPDPEAAFALYQRTNPPAPAEPASYSPPGWQYEADLMPNAKDWFTNPDAAEDQAIAATLAEIRKGDSE